MKVANTELSVPALATRRRYLILRHTRAFVPVGAVARRRREQPRNAGASQLWWLAAFWGVMDAGDEFASVYAREGEAVLIFLARRTLDVAVAAD